MCIWTMLESARTCWGVGRWAVDTSTSSSSRVNRMNPVRRIISDEARKVAAELRERMKEVIERVERLSERAEKL